MACRVINRNRTKLIYALSGHDCMAACPGLPDLPGDCLVPEAEGAMANRAAELVGQSVAERARRLEARNCSAKSAKLEKLED